MNNEDVLFLVSGLTLLAALIAAWYSYRSDRRKSGIDVQGSYAVVSSVASSDKYIGRVLLQNLKDRVVVIFAIYLEIDHGHYLEIEEFRDQPLVLGPFNAFQKEYEPIDFYMSGSYRIAMDRALDAKRTRRRLVLSTAQGRYNIGTTAVPWDPIRDFFRNHLTNIVRPMRSRFKDKSYGSGTKYVVVLTTDGGDEEIIPIYQHDHEVRKFRDFQLTFESLRSREALEVFLLERAVAGDLHCSDLTVFDLEEWRSTAYEHHGPHRVMDARLCGWFTYNILGWLLTRWSDFALRRRNRKNRQKNREALDAKARREKSTGE